MANNFSPFSIEDHNDLLFKVVKSKNDNTISVITGCDKDNVLIGSVWRKYQRLLDDYIFLDGTPCGKNNL